MGYNVTVNDAKTAIVFEGFSVKTGERQVINEWFPDEAKQMSAYRMRWLRRGTSWVRLTYPDGTVREYGKPEPVEVYPEAVAVDTRDGMVFRAAEDGVLFSVATAQAFADRRNDNLKPEHQTIRVFKLVPVE